MLKTNYNKKPFKFSNKKASWKMSIVILLTIMISSIILLPTMIVMLTKPVTNDDQRAEVVAVNEEQDDSLDELSGFTVAVKRTATGEIEEVPLEKYVMSVVAAEMPAEFELEALKAQAVAARTYIVNHLLRNDENEDIITDTEEHQVYKNEEELKMAWGSDYHWKIDKVKEAVLATKDKIITYQLEPITPTFFSMSNGYTEDAENYWGTELPYLKSVESKWEVDHPKFSEQTIFPINEISSKLNIPLTPNSQIAIELKRNESNRVSEVVINGHQFTGREIREKLGLRSNDFTIQQKNDHFIFTTKGYGHGVGMSQYGANGMAEEGKTYEEILSYYYQDIEISSINDVAKTLIVKHNED